MTDPVDSTPRAEDGPAGLDSAITEAATKRASLPDKPVSIESANHVGHATHSAAVNGTTTGDVTEDRQLPLPPTSASERQGSSSMAKETPATKFSIRIPRKAVGSNETRSPEHSPSTASSRKSGSSAESLSKKKKSPPANDELRDPEEVRKEVLSKLPKRARKTRKASGDSDAESAYTESGASDESEDVYSDSEDDEEGEEDDEYNDEDDDDNDDWDNYGRRTKKPPPRRSPTKFTSYNYPVQQSGMHPLMASTIPILSRSYHPQQGAPYGPPAPTPVFTAAQLQELAKNTISSLANVTPSGKKLPLLLPRTLEATSNIRANVSQELKQTLTSMLVNPALRAALLQKLHANKVAAAGGQQATPSQMPMAMRPPPPPMQRAVQTPPPRKLAKPKSVSRAAGALVADDTTPIAARRARRTLNKPVNYAEMREDEEEGISDEEPVKNKHYVDEDEEATDEEDIIRGSNETVSDEPGIEKILSHRVVGGEEEFLVKFHKLSYLHVEWISREELQEERNGASRIKRFLSKPLSHHHYSSKHVFNPEYTQVDRIVYGWSHPDEFDKSITTSSYLVKWCSLPYEAAAWEKRATLDKLPEASEKIQEYEQRFTLEQKRNNLLPIGKRPDPSQWQQFTESPAYKNANSLRVYQLEGLNWLVYCWMNKQSCIIADEMGLGKTVQSVSFMNLVYHRFHVHGPFLIVAPLSTIPHWEREFQAWTNLNCLVYHGTMASRELMHEYEFYYKDDKDRPIPGITKFDVLITTYEMALAGFDHLQNIIWRIAVFDEAHRLKNKASKASEILKAYQIEHKILLTGTPLQNNLEELWSLLNFLQPHRFFSEEIFLQEFGNLQRSEDVTRLQQLLKPLMLRRLKEDVETSIPIKEETIIEVELTAVQKRYYRAILERNFAFLTKGCKGANAPNLINVMMELRKCCIHPYLIKGAEERILDECSAKSHEEQFTCLVQASGKLVLVDKLLRKLREQGRRLLIFSQMVRCLDLLSDYLKWRNYPFERIDGAVKGEARQAAIDRFCDASLDSFAFLLCTRAGGVGINLTAADTVIIFDSDWNPQNDIQAQARCHRIGQTKAVKVYRLITRNTYERDMFDRAGMKLGLDRAVLQKMGPSSSSSTAATPILDETGNVAGQLSKKEVETLLKKGAYGMLMDNDEDSHRFCEQDIDQILEQRTTVIRHNAGGGGADGVAAAGDAGSIFSKASFAATADDYDVDIDDPNFWELWARRLNLDPRQLLSSSGVVVDEPRIRRQLRRLKAEESLEVEPLDKVELHPVATLTPEAELFMGWSREERLLFVSLLMTFGTERLDRLLEYLPGRSRNDLVACLRQLIKFCIEHGTDDDSKFKEDNEKLLLAHIDFDRASGEDRVETPVLEAAEDTKAFLKSDIPYPGATRRQILEYRSFFKDATETDWARFKENSRRILLRLQLVQFLRQLVESHNKILAASQKEEALPIPTVSGGPAEWWSKEADEALLFGVYRHGYGQYETIRSDPSLLFSTMKFEEGAQAVWPDNASLNERVLKLVLSMEKRTQAAAKIALQAMANPLPASRRRPGEDDEYFEMEDEDIFGKRKSGGRSRRNTRGPSSPTRTRWSKRDRGEFQRLTVTYGLPSLLPGTTRRDWTMFRKLGTFSNTLTKATTDAPFEEYCDVFLRACKAATDKPGKSSKKTKKASKKEEEEFEDEEFEDEEEEEEEIFEGDDKDEAAEKYRGSKPSSAELPAIPADRARKALTRIGVFDRLRSTILIHPDLEDLLGRARRSGGLPRWWVTGLYDAAFLRAVAKYGIQRIDMIICDEEFPFFALYRDYVGEIPSLEPQQPENEKEKAVSVTKEKKGLVAPGLRESKRMRGTPQVEAVVEDDTVMEDATAAEPVTASESKKAEDGALPKGHVDPALIDWPHESIIMRRLEYLCEMVINEDNRRRSATPSAKKARGKKAPAADGSPSGSSPRARLTLKFSRNGGGEVEEGSGAGGEKKSEAAGEKKVARKLSKRQTTLADSGSATKRTRTRTTEPPEPAAPLEVAKEIGTVLNDPDDMQTM